MDEKSAIKSVRPDVGVADVLAGVEILLQPIVDLATGAVFAQEALARFGHAPAARPDDVIARAHAGGYGYALEAACLRAALARRDDLPHGVLLSVNLSPDVAYHPVVARSWPDDLDGVIVEVTEAGASNPAALHDQLTLLRQRGARIAVDDVSTGYSGLLRLAAMRPDFVKVDRSVVSGVRDSVARSAVLEALVTLSHRLGGAVIGEGVERLDDLTALADFDVDFGQGYAIGRPALKPMPISRLVVASCRQSRRGLLQRRPSPGGAAANADGMHSVTSALANATGLAELHAAVARAATELDVDVLSVSVLGADRCLREIASSGAVIDASTYALDDYPATRSVLATGNTIEIHIADATGDTAEKRLLERAGYASLLMIPLTIDGQPIGLLEFAHRTHRRWTSHDIAHGRGLAIHLAHALIRIDR